MSNRLLEKYEKTVEHFVKDIIQIKKEIGRVELEVEKIEVEAPVPPVMPVAAEIPEEKIELNIESAILSG